jgi:hypothetical protein
VLLLGLMAVYDVLLVQARHAAEASSAELTLGIARALAAHLDERIADVDAVLAQADRSAPQPGERQGADAALAALLIGRPELRAILVTDAAGLVTRSANASWAGADLGGSP